LAINLLVVGPLSIELLREIALGTLNGCNQSVGVEAELDLKFLVEVDELLGFFSLNFDRILSPHFVDKGHLAIGKLNLLTVSFKVLSDCLLDVGHLDQLFVDDVANILENEVEFADWGTLNEVLDNLSLDTAHL
jgi:hypothetical protein